MNGFNGKAGIAPAKRTLYVLVGLLCVNISIAKPPPEHAEPTLERAESPPEQTAPPAKRAESPLEQTAPPAKRAEADAKNTVFHLDPPGFEGRSTVLFPEFVDPSDGFLPLADRWRVGFPRYDRLGRRVPADRYTTGAVSGNYQYVEGHWWDPYNQNIFKGDYPILGQHTFLNATFISDTLYEYRSVPTPAGESTERTDSRGFFGEPNQQFIQQNLIAKIDLFHGSAAYKPFDWRLRVTPVWNLNFFEPREQGVVGIDVRRGAQRERRDFAIQELFFEAKLTDVSPHYDFINLRIGRQPFVSDFRGFIFNDINDAVRLFGNDESNRIQWNIAYFYQAEKETNSELNTFDARGQHVFIANLYRQDALDFEFLPPMWRKGYTSQVSFHFNYDDQNTRGLTFDKNGFLARPDPVGSFEPHDVKVAYFGWAGDGHIGLLNITHAFYWAIGRDSMNPIAGRDIDINAQMFALELSRDYDWFRLRSSFLWASGDSDPQDKKGRGFDAIFDNPNFAGGPFSFWNRQAIRLVGVNLVNRQSIFPDLTSSKTQGQANFVNPGLFLVNAGFDADITPKLKAIVNANYMWFAHTDSLELYLQQAKLSRDIGGEVSAGFQYRPLLNNNVILNVGMSAFWPGNGFEQLLETDETLYSVFTSLTLTF